MAPTTFQQAASSSLSLPPHSYIYSLTQSSTALAAISSDDSLRVFDRETLQLLPGALVNIHHRGVTCLTSTNRESGRDLLATAGRDGSAKIWDVRNGKEVARFGQGNPAAITALTYDSRRDCLVAGTELASSQASIIAWDVRVPSRSLFQFIESHCDDVTALQFHPARDFLLLSGSTDGLVNIYDTSIQEEEDALYQVINHGSVHHAGFVSDEAIYALSHDEQFSIHPLNFSSEDALDVKPGLFGDLRPLLECEYAVEVLSGAQGPALAVGSHSAQRIDLVPLTSHPMWTFDRNETIRLSGGHGDEIVRSVFVDGAARSVFTAGEDGMVRVWREVTGKGGGQDMVVTSEEPLTPKSKEGRRHHSGRYKPY